MRGARVSIVDETLQVKQRMRGGCSVCCVVHGVAMRSQS
jgi:hypothetical protein